ncbi:MAG: SH3 domain-containing protein [Alphaproteobacteria bacterium]|nr:SH3 domain-containing protein [Alphaproteobacteria bacterium]
MPHPVLSFATHWFARWAKPAIAALGLIGILGVASVSAQSGPMPRFVSLASGEINVRVGPGQRYDIAWVFVKQGLPVEIIQEYDNWRKIRDNEGAEGWVHRNLLSGARTALVAPWLTEGEIPVMTQPNSFSPLRVRAAPRVLVSVLKCDSEWCRVTGTYPGDAGGNMRRFSGWIAQDRLWGVYSGEQLK